MAVVLMVPGWEAKVGWVATQMVHEVGDAIEREIRRDLSWHRDSGDLYRSFRMRKTARQVRFYIGTDHWRHFEYGTRPHTIRPRTKKALRFTKDGHVIITKRVSHPGTRAYSPLRRACTRSGLSPSSRRCCDGGVQGR